MSVLSSPSAFMLNLNAQGLFSSQTAFQRPKLNSDRKIVQSENSRTSLSHSTETQAKRTYKPVQITLKDDDSELVFCEPKKKVKFSQTQPKATNLLINAKNQTQQKPSKLTVEMVFDAPSKSMKAQPDSFFDDENDDDCSLSFISSNTSIDGLEAIDEEVIKADEEKNDDCMVINDSQKNLVETTFEPLVVKDSFAGHLNYLNTENYVAPNMINYPMISYIQYPNTTQFMTYNSSLNNISPINQYIQPNMNSYQPIQAIMNYPQIHVGDYVQNPSNFLFEDKVLSDHINRRFENIRVKAVELEEDGYDSDSHATKSTGLEPNQDGTEKSLKSSSPLYSVTEEIPIEDKIQITTLEKAKKKKRGRKPKSMLQQGANELDGSSKAKKGRALNLDIDINPKHLKVERRLNKLQLLRYQQEAPVGEFEEYMKKISELMPISRDNSLFNETNDSQSTTSYEGKANMTDSQAMPFENTLAVIPPFTLEPSRRRPVSVTVWTPECINEEELENYYKQLGEIVEFPVTDQEKSLKLLKTFGMNIAATLEAVRENKDSYAELFKVKVRRLRRY